VNSLYSDAPAHLTKLLFPDVPNKEEKPGGEKKLVKQDVQ